MAAVVKDSMPDTQAVVPVWPAYPAFGQAWLTV